jgi:hypothetical protein
MKWLPIESAPKDGTWVIVYGEKYKQPIIAKWNKRISWWAGAVLMGGGFQHMREASHWMPLPPPPEADNDH